MMRRTLTVVGIGLAIVAAWTILGRANNNPAPPVESPHLADPPAAVPAIPIPETPAEPPVDDLANADGAVADFAAAFMRAYARPKPAGANTWWPKVRPMMTDDCADDVVGTDPTNIPYTRVTGPSAITPTDPDASEADPHSIVTVPTDYGPYRLHVQLVIPGISTRLLVDHIEAPQVTP